MSKLLSRILLFMMLFASCNFTSEHEGYERKRHGIYYKLIKFGEDNKKPSYGDYITVGIKYSTINDSVFFEGRRRLKLTKTEYKGSVDDCFLMLSKGDAAWFIIPAKALYEKTLNASLPGFLDDDSEIKIFIEMINIQSEQEYENEKEAFIKWIKDFGEYEKVLLKQYLEKNELDITPTDEGFYHITAKDGTGERVKKGDTLILHYEGRFLNGQFFDSTRKRNQPFSFIYGQKWQLIEGLEKGIGRMREGEKAIFILPSELAFKASGSSTGIIPPYTSLIFEVELLKIN